MIHVLKYTYFVMCNSLKTTITSIIKEYCESLKKALYKCDHLKRLYFHHTFNTPLCTTNGKYSLGGCSAGKPTMWNKIWSPFCRPVIVSLIRKILAALLFVTICNFKFKIIASRLFIFYFNYVSFAQSYLKLVIWYLTHIRVKYSILEEEMGICMSLGDFSFQERN